MCLCKSNKVVTVNRYLCGFIVRGRGRSSSNEGQGSNAFWGAHPTIERGRAPLLVVFASVGS